MNVMRTYIAGTPYHKGAYDAVAKLQSGDVLLLIREPSNHYDSNAVAVHTADGMKLGYVPRIDAIVTAKILDLELKCACYFAGYPSRAAISIEWEA